MSYNTRRQYNAPQTPQSVGNIGNRRPQGGANSFQGPQLTPLKSGPVTAGGQQQQQNQQGGRPNLTSINFRNQQQNQTPVVSYQTQQGAQQQQQQQQKPVAQLRQPQVAQQATQQAASAQQQQQQQATQQQAAAAQQAVKAQQAQQMQAQIQQAVSLPSVGGSPPFNASNDGDVSMDGSENGPTKKRFWNKPSVKISKKEKQRRRNMKLSKILQPKNALMILNELVKNPSPTFNVIDFSKVNEDVTYKAIVVVDEMEHVGYGKTKLLAKSNAAETALKYMVKHKKFVKLEENPDAPQAMEVAGEEDVTAPLPWQHVASFALFKLFSSWGENPNVVLGGNAPVEAAPKEHKPAKKLPDNATELNPLMLLNQMLPHAKFEELPRLGTPPNVTFSFRCSVDGQTYMGSANTKKTAKRLTAYEVCHKVLNLNYPIEVFTPTA